MPFTRQSTRRLALSFLLTVFTNTRSNSDDELGVLLRATGSGIAGSSLARLDPPKSTRPENPNCARDLDPHARLETAA
jgi:hypothetical protein